VRTTYHGTLVSSCEPSGGLRHDAPHEIHVQYEDAGQSWIAEFGDESEVGMFVRLQSWDPNLAHDHMRMLMNKRVRITVEVLDSSHDRDEING
jgi:hypothetical protein